ncbi:hypothetical protein GGF43_004793, partial [Coemansia sp. RSA 2618]
MFSISRRAFGFANQISRRRLWIAASSTDPSLTTATTQCINTIRASLCQNQRPANRSNASTCFILVSQTYPAFDIECLTSNINQHLDKIGQKCHLSGTVVDQIIDSNSGSAANGLSLLFHLPEATESSQPFYIGDEHGRQRLREVAVGRWHNQITDRSRIQTSTSLITWTPGQSSVTQATSHLQPPPELTTAMRDPLNVHLVLFASDRETHEVLQMLDAQFPRATKLGLVGTQTPFLNAREFTLLDNTVIHSQGVVGVAFSTRNHKIRSQKMRVSHVGVQPISDVLRINRCKGNVVLELDEGASAQSLIASLRSRRLQKGTGHSDARLFARVARARDASMSESVVLQVTGGNPAKGGIALDTLCDLAPGQYIQFMMLKDAAGLQAVMPTGGQAHICFGVSGAHKFGGLGSAAPGLFGGVTEGGFSYGGPQLD